MWELQETAGWFSKTPCACIPKSHSLVRTLPPKKLELPDNGKCAVDLTQQKSKSRCVLNVSCGCLSADTMYVAKRCRGRFICNGKLVACGYSRAGSFTLSTSRQTSCKCVAAGSSDAHRQVPPWILKLEDLGKRSELQFRWYMCSALNNSCWSGVQPPAMEGYLAAIALGNADGILGGR